MGPGTPGAVPRASSDCPDPALSGGWGPARLKAAVGSAGGVGGCLTGKAVEQSRAVVGRSFECWGVPQGPAG